MPLDELLARATGTLCRRSGASDVVDASVVVLAQLVDGAIVSSDITDLRRLIQAGGVDITIHQI